MVSLEINWECGWQADHQQKQMPIRLRLVTGRRGSLSQQILKVNTAGSYFATFVPTTMVSKALSSPSGLAYAIRRRQVLGQSRPKTTGQGAQIHRQRLLAHRRQQGPYHRRLRSRR